ncbi:hypothetical protein D3C84_484540 [compost metagenome]
MVVQVLTLPVLKIVVIFHGLWIILLAMTVHLQLSIKLVQLCYKQHHLGIMKLLK